MYQISKLHHLPFSHPIKKISAFLICLPTSLFALFLLFLLAYNGFFVFYVYLPFPAKTSPETTIFSPEILTTNKTITNFPYLSLHAVKEKKLPENSIFLPENLTGDKTTTNFKTKTHFLRKPKVPKLPIIDNWRKKSKRRNFGRHISRYLSTEDDESRKLFSGKVKGFFVNSNCKTRFFITWISSVESFGKRELLCVESLFKSHPNACLLILSNSFDSRKGDLILSPFRDKGFKILAIKPDYNYLFKNTPAESWFKELTKGHIDPGEVSLGQNLSNLLRLALLYKYGGTYVDTDVIILRSFENLRNVIGAQMICVDTKNWTRLNNAVLIFDKKHPLVYKFIEEFATTFNGNKWGYNGPYMVSRVVLRVSGKSGYNFTVMPPPAFYPVDWSRIHGFFQGPKDEGHAKWLRHKLGQIRKESFAVHLWNRQSKKLVVEEGSIIDRIKLNCCIFCNSLR